VKWWTSILLGAAVAGALVTWRAFGQSVPHRPDVVATAELRKRGEYLVRAGNCVGCHTAVGQPPFAGGRKFDLGGMGNLYSSNITPDKQTGIGDWNDDDFRAAMQIGVGKGGKHLYPAFPYASYTRLSDDDVVAIKAYLFSVPPVHAAAPANALRFPFNQRYLMAYWGLFFNPNQRQVTDAGHSPLWNRGRYLVEGLGHCGECHTPRNLLQAPKRSAVYAGAVADNWLAYNITADASSGIGGWSDEALKAYLTTGFAAGHGPASGPMAEVVSDSLRYLTSDDIGAMIEYLRTIAPIRATPAADHPQAGGQAASLEHGRRVYAGICANCHSADGEGSQTQYEALRGAHSLLDPRANNMTAAVLYGTGIETQYGHVSMPAFAQGYSDADLAAVINYASATLGGGAVRLDAAAVHSMRRAD
jgi:mono/diheme cytochrome c family protein